MSRSRFPVLASLTALLIVICARGVLCAQPAQPAKPAPQDSSAGHSSVDPADQDQKAKADAQGLLTGANLYTNPVLGMTLQLTGEWMFMDDRAKVLLRNLAGEDAAILDMQAPYHVPQCTGPLCDMAVNVSLITQPKPPIAVRSIFINAFKLSPPYLDRKRYPLVAFAKAMMANSFGPDLKPMLGLTSLTIGGKPAYRQLVSGADPEAAPKQLVGYVVETNGYMVMLVGSAYPMSNLESVKAAIENTKFAGDAKQQP